MAESYLMDKAGSWILLPSLVLQALGGKKKVRNERLSGHRGTKGFFMKKSIGTDFQMYYINKLFKCKQKPLDESERGEWKSWLKAQHSEN